MPGSRDLPSRTCKRACGLQPGGEVIETQSGPEEAATREDRGRQGRAVRLKGDGSNSPRTPLRAALTFDDGPDAIWTPRILDALRRADVRATFFLIAPLALAHPNIVSSMLEAGHGVEFHCTEHVRHTHRSRKEIEDDTREGLGMLRILGVKPRLWRTPWGILAPWTEEVAGEFGLALAPWNADTHDWRGDEAPDMLRYVEPLLGPGSIVLMHDGLGPGSLRTGCEETVSLVGELVARLRSMGCEPSPLVPNQEVRA